MQKITYFIFALCVLASCQKKQASGYVSELLELPTEHAIRSVGVQPNGAIRASGGTIFGSGIVLERLPNATTWDTLAVPNQGVPSLDYRNGEFSFVQAGNTLYREQTPQNYQSYLALGWWNWQQHIQLDNGTILLVGGENFGRGFIHIQQVGQSDLTLVDTFEHELRDIAYTSQQEIYVVGYGLVMQSSDGGYTWQHRNVTGDFFVGVDFPTAEVGYVLGEYGSVHKTTDAGTTWKQVRLGNSLFANGKVRFKDLAFWDENQGLLVATNNRIWRTQDGGKTWHQLNDLEVGADFESITIHDERAYLGATQGRILQIDLE